MVENAPGAVELVGLLVGLSLLPFVAVMVSSFVKIIVVVSLVRNALGIQQIPPNMVINGLAIILTIFVMNPVIQDTYEALQQHEFTTDIKSFDGIKERYEVAKTPLVNFLKSHSEARERGFFMQSARMLWGKERAENLNEDDMMVLVPSFTVTELTAAFQIGFLLYLPFVAIDLIVSNILMAMGMMMVSPMTISLPFKLMLFVLVDGWSKLIQGLLLTYK